MTAIGGLFGGSMQSCNVSNYEHHQDSLTLHQLGVSGGPLHGLMDYLVTAETPAQAGTKLTMFTFAAIYSILAWRRLGSDKPERLVDRT
ncbi:MAG TPA: hypothetical protein VLE99_01980 [Candidatus Saccharimonadales bacterium]|nr:hypothetical protein [Candidatus Saccharimonadales bacterium]